MKNVVTSYIFVIISNHVLVSFSVTSVPITHKIRMKEFGHQNAIWQETQGKYTCTVHWVGHVLTHWGRVTHICVSKLTIIGSDNGLSPGRRQAIIWTNARILLIWPLGTNFSGISIDIQTFLFKKIHFKMSSGKWRPFCLGLNVLKNVKELYPIQKSNVVVLLKIVRLSLKPKILHNFKTTWVFFKIENGPNSGNAKRLCAFTKWSTASFCKKVIESISAGSIVKKWMLHLTWMEQGSINCSVACQ